jgi:hypothetical protein
MNHLVALLTMVLGSLVLPHPVHGQTAPASQPNTMDQAIALLTEARMHFQNVHDYQCRLIKRERVNGTLLPEGILTMKVRNEPFAVYLRFESPADDRGLEVCYVQGRNGGMMRVRPTGWVSLLGFWSVDPHDARAFEKSRHCITEAGLGNLLNRTAWYWDMERRVDKTQVWITDDEVNGRSCTRVETIHPDRNAASYYGYRSVIWLDKSTHLPIGAETYDWARQGGPAGGELLESYRFLDLRCNIGLRDDVFDK